jgi:tripartite-type tricarboxylate transporter receptor subunit TctC
MKKMSKVMFILGMIFTTAILFVPGYSYAQYPEKSITIIVPWAAGGVTDTTTRALSSVTGRYLPVALAVLNRPGAGGSIGQTELVKAKPDGYTIAMNTGSCLFIEPLIHKLPYSKDDYIIIMQVFSEDSIIAAYPDRPYNNMREMIDYAKSHPKEIKFGIHAPLTTGHLAALQLQLDNKVEFKIVPMGGGGPMKTALLGGHIDVAPLGVSEAMQYVKANKLKALGVTGSRGIERFPGIITCEKQGFPVTAPVVGYLMAPKGTSEDKIKILNDAFKKGIQDRDFLKMAEALNLQIVYLDHQAALAKFDEYYNHFDKLIKVLGLAEK